MTGLPPRLLLLCALGGGCFDAGGVRVERRRASPGTQTALGETVELSRDGAWCWFAEPRVLRHRGREDQTYVGYVSSAGAVTVTAVDHRSDAQVTAQLRMLSADDHNSPALLVHPDGRLFACYSQHDAERLACRWTTRPGDLSTWSAERRIAVNVAGTRGQTYPTPVSLRDEGGRMFLFFRGASWMPLYTTSYDGEAWSPARVWLRTPRERPYVKYASDGRGRIHFAYTDGHPRESPNTDLYYAYYERGALYRADGTLIRRLGGERPLFADEGDLVYSAAVHGATPAWLWDIAVAPHGRAVIAYATLPSPEEHRYHLARFSAGAWRSTLLTDAGPSIVEGTAEPHYSGGIALDQDDPRRLVLSRAVEGVHEIERWETADEGASWTVAPITRGSAALNVRPVFVRGGGEGGPEVLWMNGRYEHYHRGYHTRILGWSAGRASRQPRAR